MGSVDEPSRGYAAGRGLFSNVPRGEHLDIERTYDFGPDGDDLPEGWKREWIVPSDPEPKRYGFDPAPTYILDEKLYFTEVPGSSEAAYMYLRGATGDLVATWDEGRWWTPEESRAFKNALLGDTAVRSSYGAGKRRVVISAESAWLPEHLFAPHLAEGEDPSLIREEDEE